MFVYLVNILWFPHKQLCDIVDIQKEWFWWLSYKGLKVKSHYVPGTYSLSKEIGRNLTQKFCMKARKHIFWEWNFRFSSQKEKRYLYIENIWIQEIAILGNIMLHYTMYTHLYVYRLEIQQIYNIVCNNV